MESQKTLSSQRKLYFFFFIWYSGIFSHPFILLPMLTKLSAFSQSVIDFHCLRNGPLITFLTSKFWLFSKLSWDFPSSEGYSHPFFCLLAKLLISSSAFLHSLRHKYGMYCTNIVGYLLFCYFSLLESRCNISFFFLLLEPSLVKVVGTEPQIYL